MLNPRSAGAAALAALVLLLAACAQDTAPRPAPATAAAKPALPKADANDDGRITPAEYDSYAEALFVEVDKDRSGDLTVTEIEEARPLLTEAEGRPLDPVLLERWTVRTDTNRDGRVSRAEWQAAHREAYARRAEGQPSGLRTGDALRANPILVFTF